MAGKIATIVLAGVLALSACDESGSGGIPGTYSLAIQESRDTCDQELNQVGATVTITRSGDGFLIHFTDEAQLTGSLSADGVLVAQGPITIRVEGQPVEATMELGLAIRRGRIDEGAGRLTFNGTFPGVGGLCVQEFSITGTRRSLTPIIG